ncbi:UNVERIFIED_CONTAM: hypothetical protein KB570_01520 [Streptococcus canis]|uniref:hypothetical protein n=1 Tax=Streptococcus canis TaxID=1329 RepID=UPI0013DC61ED|nr:hypothetical protein [Streptococcus canis]QKG76385.1 hypothetical protein GE022_009225 [Streptococcus canis]GMX36463.1 hypothetical protein SpKU43_15420 [Streptococcus canis]GMX39656.1 hypothetical protein ScKU71_08790 [Streptococcus canis]
MRTYFPSIKHGDLDVTDEWLVQKIDEPQQTVVFEGRGMNDNLLLEVDYSQNLKALSQLSLGELVALPKEWLVTETVNCYQPDWEWF